MAATRKTLEEHMALLDYSSSPHAVRARELRADRMLSRLYHKYGVADYVWWSKQPESLIQSASSIDGGLQLRMFSVEYTFTTHREVENAADTRLIWLKLTADGRTVYEAKYLEIGEYDELILVSVARFEEGEWLQHFRALVDERKKADIASKKEKVLYELTDDEFYGYSLTLAESSESQCHYGSGSSFPRGCPLRGSEHVLNFADGPSREWMCEYHWAQYFGTIRNLGKGTSSDAPPDVELRTVPRPRRCEWVGCGRRVRDAVVLPSWGTLIPVLFFFCEEHRPVFLEWRNDRTRSVQFRLGPVIRKKVYVWLASSNGWQRLWLVIVGILGLTVALFAVALTVASWPEDYALLWILAGLFAWGLSAALLYGIGVLVAWVRRGFSMPPAVS
jgi:hypothetical protein